MSVKMQKLPEYEVGLLRRGSMMLWLEQAVLERCRNIGPTSQALHPNIAFETSLMLHSAFKMALPKTEGLMASILALMNLTITALV